MWHFVRRSVFAFAWINLVCDGFLLFGDRTATNVMETILNPWFGFCAWITPSQWQTTGNSLLGMLWLFSGVAALSMRAGMAVTAGWYLARRTLFSKRTEPA